MLSPLWLEVINGFRTVKVAGIQYDLLLPTFSTLHESQFYVRQAEEELLGVAYTADALEYQQEDLLSEKDILMLDSYEERKAELEHDLGIQTNAGKRQIVRQMIIRLDAEKQSVDYKWYRIRAMSSEGYASIVQTHYCFYRGTRYTDTHNPVWNSYEEFLCDRDQTRLIRILIEYYINFTSEFTDSVLRSMARDGFYRVMHQVMKEHNMPVFNSVSDLNMVAIKLLYWIEFYANALQSATEDCPKEILEDDEAFDLWVDRQRKGITNSESGQSDSNISRVRGRGRETIVVG